MKDRIPYTCIKCGTVESYGKAENINPDEFECSECQTSWLWSSKEEE